MTVGSEGISSFSDPVSLGAASLRENLRKKAAEKSGAALDQVKDARGGFEALGMFIGYSSLIPKEAEVLTVATDDNVRRYMVNPPSPGRAVGQRWKLHDIKDIVTGKTTYSRDISLPDMLYGDAVRPPRFGVTLKSFVDQGAKDLPGVVAVIADKSLNLVGVVAESPFVLEQALEKIDVTWEAPAPGFTEKDIDVSLYRHSDDFEHTLAEEGNLSVGAENASQRVQARYATSFMAHAAMEPRASVVSVTPDRVDVWCGSQDPFFVRARIANQLARKPEDVIVHPLRMGGGFGGRVISQPSDEAALFSAKLARPVRVQWSRETEFQQNYFQPKFSHALDAGVGKDGKISHWRHDFISSPIIFGLAPKEFAPVLDTFVADEGTARGAELPYFVPNKRVRYSDIRTDIPVGAWRGLGSAPNTFAIESMMDELALAAGEDALSFRLEHLVSAQNRLSNVLRRVGDLSPWGRPSSKDQGLGLACAVYKAQAYVAIVAAVKVEHDQRRICVSKIWCVQDCGLVVNPDQVENQVLGNLIWGCGMVLKEKASFAEGVIEQQNFGSYEILRHDEAPSVHIELIEAANEKPVAVGESAFAPVAAAIANAVFAATGKRPRSLPFSYDSLYS